MTRDEHKQKVNSLLGLVTPENQATLTGILAELIEDYDHVLTDGENANTKVAELTQNNETLRSVNAKLFLKVGEIPKDPPPEDKTGTADVPENNITFDSLFNDKGELI